LGEAVFHALPNRDRFYHLFMGLSG